ncbi:AP-1 complex subunit beta-1, putative [Entamoeba invadens IP1]|uniref:AP-1 complex subunit beta-1, putative n=1 Tax=Entamoeba invadens IP1 TaxID=370355 RepID=A0A0A1U539_ENTIV|nr:AP-1 complex subunit beta-1, putative [Entamoeba invadens IP1]ELP89425.1 AP-1 complex subunit beta-1, putative [Entamoeba invadens IP1]|eukprot:XP_004256196.1 AP-1 complex subunit beta-1, putative [Entamoeba invadens IP1]
MRKFLFGNVGQKTPQSTPSTPTKKIPKKYKDEKQKDELQELKDCLQSKNVNDQKEAMKKIVLATAEGKECGFMYMDVLKIIGTPDISLKQLIYLYIATYASVDEQEAILTVNSLIIDSTNHDPHVKGLAFRTMGNIKLKTTAEYFVQPLIKGLKDSDSYVKRCAILSLLKILQIPNVTVDFKAIGNSILNELEDGDSVVVAAILSVASEIPALSRMVQTEQVATKVVHLLEGSNDWDQSVFLKYFNEYKPHSKREAEMIVQTVFDKCSVVNEGIVIDTLKLVLRFKDFLDPQTLEEDYVILANIILKVNAKLTSQKQHEMLYILYRNIKHFITLKKELFSSQISCFYIMYEDPIFLRTEKIEILLLLVEESTVKDLLDELSESATASLDFAPRLLLTISTLVTKFPSLGNKCVSVIVKISREVPMLSESCLVSLCEILLTTNGKYMKALPCVLENIQEMGSADAKVALLTLCGEFPNSIENPREVLLDFIEHYQEESLEVRLSLMIATAKVYQALPFTETTRKVLECAMKSNEYVERELAVSLWRKLAKSEKIVHINSLGVVRGNGNKDFLYHIGEVSTVLEISPSKMHRYIDKPKRVTEISLDSEKQNDVDNKNIELFKKLKDKLKTQRGLYGPEETDENKLMSVGNNPNDFVGSGFLFKKDGVLYLRVGLKNISKSCISGLFIQFDSNSFGATCGNFEDTSFENGEVIKNDIPISFDETKVKKGPLDNSIRIGIAHKDRRVSFYTLKVPIYFMMKKVESIEPRQSAELFHKMPFEKTLNLKLFQVVSTNVKTLLTDTIGFQVVAEKVEEQNAKVIVRMVVNPTYNIIGEINVLGESNAVNIHLKSENETLLDAFCTSLQTLF